MENRESCWALWIGALALAAAPATGAAQMCGGGNSDHSGHSTHQEKHHEEKVSAETVGEAITEYVERDAQLKGGYFLLYDAEQESTAALTLERVHDDELHRVGDRKFVACADFRTPQGEAYDLDLFMKQDDSEAGALEVTEVAVHVQNGLPRYVWEDRGDTWKRKKIRPEDRAAAAAAQSEGVAPRYTITVDDMGFRPRFLSVPRGSTVTLVVTRKTDRTCVKELVIPALDIREELPLDQPVEIPFTAEEKGDIRFGCAMKMFTGVIRVE